MATTSSQNPVGASCRSESLDIDIESLFAGLEIQAGGDGYTTAEIIERTGLSVELARRRIKAAILAGRCKPARKRITSMDGRVMSVPSYVFTR